MPSATVGALGFTVSRVKLPVPADPVLPAASVATALTLTAPLPSVTRSPAVSVTAWAEPVAVRFLVTFPLVPVKVTATALPLSAFTVTAPACASADVAPNVAAATTATVGAFGFCVSRVKLLVPALLALPAASVDTALTLTAPLPSVVSSPTVSVTAWAEPVAVKFLVTLPLVPVKVTTTALPLSADTVTTPVPAVASAAVAPPDTPVPSATVGALGFCVSRVKLLVPALLALPAASVDTALTLTAPLPSVVSSPTVSVTAWAEPVAVKFLVTLPLVPVKVTTTALPLSADTVTTPVPAVASAAVAPPDTPVPSATVGALGFTVSRVKLPVPALLALPAASVATALTLTPPLPRVTRSPAVSVTACAEPVAVTVLVTFPLVPVKVTATLLPTSADTVTTPPPAVASAAVAPPATPVPSATVGVLGPWVSRVNAVLAAAPVLPDASVATALTTTLPLPSVVRSPAVSVTATGAPVPVTLLVTLPLVPVKVTDTVLPFSADTVTTPPTAVASVEVAPPDTPVPSAKTGLEGLKVSMVKLPVCAKLVLPATSVATTLTPTRPLPKVVTSPASMVMA